MDFPVQLKVDLLPETVALLSEVHSASDVEIIITNGTEYETAAIEMQKIKGLAKNLEAARKELTKPIDSAKKDIMDHFRNPADLLAKVEKMIKNKMIDYDNEQEKLRLKLEAEEAEKARKQREKLEAQAEKAREKGQEEKAEALEETAAMATGAVEVVEDRKVAGISYKTTYTAEVKDLMALVKGVAEGRIPLAAIQADQKFLNTQAKALKENFDMMFVGCKVKREKTVAARSK
jgi:hypothetical protein